MVRSTLVLALAAALLCVTLAASIDEESALACENAVKAVGNKAKDIVKKGQKVEKIPADTEKRLQKCLKQANAPKLAALCVKNLAQDDGNKVKNDAKLIEQDVQQLEKQLEQLAKKCLGGRGGSGK